MSRAPRNPSGRNGYNNGTWLPDDRLEEVLHDFANRQISLSNRILYLQKEGMQIGLTTLKKLNRRFKVPTVRKPPPLPLASAAVSELVAEDTSAQNGPNTVRDQVRRKKKLLIPRDTVRRIMKANFPHGAERRFPGKRKSRPRGRLILGDGVFQRIAIDGHEKTNDKALKMGGVSIDHYGMRCHSSGRIMKQVVVPNARCSSTVGHVYLDFLEEYGMICETISADGGNETGELYACHRALREKYTPTLDARKYPEFVSLPSTKNIVIEGHWAHWLKFAGTNIRQSIQEGYEQGLFVVHNRIHFHTFHWIWSKVIQNEVDDFVMYWNDHKTRKQKVSNLPSGVSPNTVFDFPSLFGLKHCGTRVSKADIDTLRATLPRSREDCFRWVPDGFDKLANTVYDILGSPKLNHTNGWRVFMQIDIALRDVWVE